VSGVIYHLDEVVVDFNLVVMVLQGVPEELKEVCATIGCLQGCLRVCLSVGLYPSEANDQVALS
jgi:hypothetical protein